MRLQFDSFTGSDDTAAERAKRTLFDRFVVWLGEHPVDGADPYDLELLLEWKYRYGDGDFGTWRRADVDEVLLEHLPRKLSARPDEVRSIPLTLGAFVRFLDAAGLYGDASDLASVVAELAVERQDHFVDAMGDPSKFGMAKGMMASIGMLGGDPPDEAELERAMQQFNAMSFEERSRALGLDALGTLDDDALDAPLPVMYFASDAEVDAAAADVPLLRQVGLLRSAVAGGVVIESLESLDVAETVSDLFTVSKVAVRANAVEIDGDVLQPDPMWADMAVAECWQNVIEAVIDLGASTLSFGNVEPDDDDLSGHVDDSALHIVGMCWLCPLTLDEIIDRVDVVLADLPHAEIAAYSPGARRRVIRSRVVEAVDMLERAGVLITGADGDLVRVTPAGARLLTPSLVDAGYDVVEPEELRELEPVELIELLDERDGDVDVVTAVWAEGRDRRRLASELVAVAERHADDPVKLLIAVGILDALGRDAEPALRSSTDGPLGPHAWLLLAGMGAVDTSEVPPEMVVRAGISTFLALADSGEPGDVVDALFGAVPVLEHRALLDHLVVDDHPRVPDLLDAIGRHHPDKLTGKHARKLAHRWRSRHGTGRR